MSSAPTKTPSIPAITPSNLTEFARAVKGILEVREGKAGDALDANVTYRDLVSSGFAKVASGQYTKTGAVVVPIDLRPPGSYDPTADMTIPPQPAGLTASASFSTIMLQWDAPIYGNHAYTEVWASSVDQIGGAVMIGTSSMSMYVDAIGEPSFGRYYWIRFVSQANITGAYNATAGVFARTAIDVTGAIDALAGQISESELSSSLSTRISLIDGPESVPGSVANRVAQEASARAQSILDEAVARATADSALQTQINTLSAASTGDTTQLMAALQEEQTARIAADSAEATSRQTLAAQMRGNYTGTDITQVTTGLLYSEAQARASADSAISTNVTTLSATVATKNKTYRQAAEPTSGMTAGDVWYDSDDGNKAYRYSGTAWVATDDARIAANAAAITTEQTARANADSALATQINTLTASVSGNTAAIQQEATARASETGSLFAKYTVKVDVAGHVSGFGLASTANNAAPTSLFMVRADQFAVAPPSVSSTTAPTANLYNGMVWVDTSVTPNVTRYYTGSSWSTTPQALPFVIQATPTTLNGVSVAPGVYMPAAFIMDGSIGNAKIANLAVDDAKIATVSVDKLTAGSVSVGQYIQSTGYIPGQAGWRINGDGYAEFGFANIRGTLLASQIGADTITADKIDARGLVIKDALGNPIIQAGSAIDWSKLGGSAPNLSGLGYSGALDATKGAPAGTYVGNTLAENVESTAGAQAKVSAAQAALQAYTDAETAAAEVRAKAYADGVVTAEETRAIADAQAKADAARVAAINAAALDATNKATAAQTAAQDYAAAQAALAEVSAKAYADGVVDAEEARAIADATAKAEAARVAAVNAAALDATDKANAAQSAAISSAATDATTKANAVLATSLQKAGDAITGPVTFLTNGGILAATDANNGVFMGPNGLVGKKAGATTFAVDTAGNASFAGTLNVASAASGARMEIKNNVIKVYDANGVLRVKIGDLSA